MQGKGRGGCAKMRWFVDNLIKPRITTHGRLWPVRHPSIAGAELCFTGVMGVKEKINIRQYHVNQWIGFAGKAADSNSSFSWFILSGSIPGSSPPWNGRTTTLGVTGGGALPAIISTMQGGIYDFLEWKIPFIFNSLSWIWAILIHLKCSPHLEWCLKHQ